MYGSMHHVDGVIRRTTRQSRLFITNQGHIGLGPAGLVSGDVVFVARGGELPLALRLCPWWEIGLFLHPQSSPFLFTLGVGPAFVSGVMDEEIVAGDADASRTVHVR